MDRAARPMTTLQRHTHRYLLARELSQRDPIKEARIRSLPLFLVAWDGKAGMFEAIAAHRRVARRAA